MLISIFFIVLAGIGLTNAVLPAHFMLVTEGRAIMTDGGTTV